MQRILLTLAVVFGATFATLADDRPNIIVVFTDDHGYADLSCQGIVDDIKTPHIDSLARGGVRMTSGYVSAPQCVPSRAGLLSGRYQNRFGVESNGESLDGFNAQRTVAERLQQAGYATGMTGKWHLGPASQIPSHGFHDVYYKNANRPGWANFDLDGRDRKPGAENSGQYHIDVNSTAACAFIERHREQPFFFYCAYRAPHVPLDAPTKYLKRFPGPMPERRRQALAMISAIDDGVGRILSTLRKHQLEEKTLIFFIGDNGAPLKIHKLDAPGGGAGWDGSLNDPLNGEKGMLSEGGIRVPFVMYWKGQIPPDQTFEHPVISLDVAATAVALAGLPRDPQLDGVNLVPFLQGQPQAAPHDTLYWRWIAQSAVREGKWKYLRGGAREYLFDLHTDAEEQHNLLRKHPDIAQRLRSKLTTWSQELSPPGLETRQMATTWEQYFDFYLDGKPAPKKPAIDSTALQLQGWVARNSKASVREGALQVVPTGDSKRRPFVARSKLNLAGPVQATVRLKHSAGGSISLTWRESGQDGFPAGQSVQIPLQATGDWQQLQTAIPARKKLIQVRLILSPGQTSIAEITLRASDGKQASFRFK